MIKDVLNKVKGLFSDSSQEASDSQGTNETPTRDAAYWITRLDSSKLRQQFWVEKAREYEAKYLNESDRGNLYRQHNKSGRDKLRYNIFYANTELLHSALLTEIPQPALKRRFAKEQAQNPIKKQFYTTVSELMERAISCNVENPEIEREFDAFKYDYLITGRGVLWTHYDAELDDEGELKSESIKIEHVYYRDFRMSSGKSWKDIFWVARRHLLNQEDLVERWGKLGKKIPLNYSEKDNNQFEVSDIQRAQIWEIWDKVTKKVYFVCPSYKESVLEVRDDPYHLKGFFPTPEPLRSVHSNFTMIPTPELDLYRREAGDLSVLSARKSNIIDSTRPRAFFPARYKDIVSKINAAGDNEYIPIENMSDSMQDFFAFAPIDTHQAVAARLSEQEEHLIQVIYEITGISDIQRNISPQETATATVAKGRFGSLRLISRQKRINDYMKGVYSIVAEIICERFTIETLKEITSMELPSQQDKMQYQLNQQLMEAQYNQMQQEAQMQGMQPPPPPTVDKAQAKLFERPSWEEVKEFLENDRLRSYMMDMETTFNVWEDEQEEVKSRLAYMTALNESLQQTIAVGQSNPQYIPLMLKSASWTLAAFPRSRIMQNETDDMIAEILEKNKQMMENPPQKEPMPDELIAQAEVMTSQADQMNAQTKAREAEIKAQKVEIDAAKVAGQLDIDKNKLMLDAAKAANQEQRAVEESFNQIGQYDTPQGVDNGQ